MPRVLALMLLLFVPPGVLAAGLPGNVAPYGDPDAAARPFQAADPRNDRLLTQLDTRIADAPRDYAALSTRSWVLAQRGERDRALADAEAAAAAASVRVEMQRRVLWSAGWTAIALGDGALANQYWDRNLELTDTRPFWVPYSRAVAHALEGQLDTAVAWYELAAAAMPDRYGSRAALARTTRHWQPAQRQQIDRVFAHWKAAQVAALRGAVR